MFDFSFAELALIVVVAVVFIGPKELPVVVRAVAKAMRALKGLTREVRSQFDALAEESGLKDMERDIHMIQGDDGKMYEAYNVSPPVGGRLGGGHYEPPAESLRPHPNPPPTGEGNI